MAPINHWAIQVAGKMKENGISKQRMAGFKMANNDQKMDKRDTEDELHARMARGWGSPRCQGVAGGGFHAESPFLCRSCSLSCIPIKSSSTYNGIASQYTHPKLQTPYIGNAFKDFPGGTVVTNPPANAGDTGLSPGPGRSHMPWSN